MKINSNIFKSYDIRGIYPSELNEESAFEIGRAFARQNNVKKAINDSFGRLAIHGVCKVDSKGNDLLQVVDLLVGAITYDLKVHHKLAGQSKSFRINCKKDLLEFIKNKMGVNNFTRDVRVGNFNIKVFS